ncbi:hypothetical protein FOA43_002207 [Brettanomyces nanus]|uniref:Uncharacterized protein n=1 Tax=Eeniella nana TaxID=13502 RepID=A0A875RZB6_EENNA|nr:uncharacterized protein FOA43_002207 [Brettanomyces nanus]QPG74871.1 hypothetical protein FOA43_002207 [Brettanomyces nanus]
MSANIEKKATKAKSSFEDKVSKVADDANVSESSFKEKAAEASKNLKKTASNATKKTEGYLKKTYSTVSDYVVGAAIATKDTVVAYPVVTFNLTAVLATGITLYATSEKQCHKCTAETCKTVSSVLAGTLALVDSAAVYYYHQKGLKE